MIKKNIEYTDYNGIKRNEDYYFNLNKAEIMEMELTTTGGLSEMIQKIVNTQDTPALIKIFKEIILKAYGEKSADGKAFVKIDEEGRPLYRKFAQTEAYSVLFMELSTNAEAASAFINGVIPSDMSNEEAQAKAKAFIEQKYK